MAKNKKTSKQGKPAVSALKDLDRKPEREGLAKDMLTLQEIAVAARRNLSRATWDYLMGGAETETTLVRNRIALDSLAPNANSSLPTFSGRLVLATSNPAGLLAMGQMMVPALAQLKPSSNGKPVALPPQMAAMLGQPAWVAMGDKALALGVGNGEEAKLADMLKEPGGSAGQMTRMHLNGAMYLSWVQLMQDKVDTFTAAASAMGKSEDSANDETNDAAARSKAQFAAMKLQAERIDSIDAEMHVDSHGMVITSQTVLK